MTFRKGENDTEIDLVLFKKEYRRYIRKVKAIPGMLRHALVVGDKDKRKIRNIVRKTCAERRKISLLKVLKIKNRLENKVIKLVYVGA